MRKPRPITLDTLRARPVRGPREDGRWYWRAETRERRPSSRGARWATEGEAGRWLAELITEAVPAPSALRHTVGALLDAWLAVQLDRIDLSHHTQLYYRGCAQRLVDDLHDVPVERLSHHLDTWVQTRVRRDKGATSTLETDHATLRQVWTWGRERGVCPDRDLPRARIPRASPRRSTYTPTPEEVAATLAVVYQRAETYGSSQRVYLLLVLLWATGCRRGEVEGLRWDQVDTRRGLLHVDGKTGGRMVPVRGHALDLLRDAPREGELVVGRCSHARRSLDSACDEAGVPRWTPHALRRLAVDTMARKGVHVSTAAAYLGHSPLVMMRHYRRVSEGDLIEAAAVAGLGSTGGAVLRLVNDDKEG